MSILLTSKAERWFVHGAVSIKSWNAVGSSRRFVFNIDVVNLGMGMGECELYDDGRCMRRCQRVSDEDLEDTERK